jgi:ankyrin repeat protein
MHSFEALIRSIEAGEEGFAMLSLMTSPGLVHVATSEGETALHIACWQKRVVLAERLLALGAAVDARGFAGRTPLHNAVHEGDQASLPLVKVLLERGADPRLRDDAGFTPGEWAAIEIANPALRARVCTLLRASDDPSSVNSPS